MFYKSRNRAVWLATMGLMILAGIRSAPGDDVVVPQQTQVPPNSQSGILGAPVNAHSPEGDCDCLRCRCHRSCFSRMVTTCCQDKKLFHWYIRGNGPAIHTRPAGCYWW